MYLDNISRAVRNKTLVVLGDFNVDIVSDAPSAHVNAFIDNFRSNHLLPLISLPTRVTNHSRTCLDHIYINSLQPCQSGVLELLVTDHHAVFCSIPCADNPVNDTKVIKYRDHSVESTSKFRRDLIDRLSRFCIYDNFDLDDRFEILNNILQGLYESNFKVKCKTISMKRFGNPWINGDLLACIEEKHRLYRLSRQSPQHEERYKRYRNNLCLKIKNTKQSFYNNKFANSLGNS